MKITDVKVETIRIPMKKPFRIAFAVQDHSLNVLVKISTDEGLWGIGEAAPFEPVTGESAATVLEALKLFRTGLIGMDPLDVEGIHRMMDRLLSGNTSAKAAVDIALYDIKGKLMGQPLYKVLGGSVNQIVTDMTVGIDTPEAMAGGKGWLHHSENQGRHQPGRGYPGIDPDPSGGGPQHPPACGRQPGLHGQRCGAHPESL